MGATLGNIRNGRKRAKHGRGTVVTHERTRNAWLRMAALICDLYPMGHMMIGHLPGINTPLQFMGTLKQFLKAFF